MRQNNRRRIRRVTTQPFSLFVAPLVCFQHPLQVQKQQGVTFVSDSPLPRAGR